MIARIVRILLIITAVMLLALHLPTLYRKCFEEKPLKKLLYYSEVDRDFVFSTESYDSTTLKRRMKYRDSKGNVLTEKQYAARLPFDHVRKLKKLGMMPDSVMGRPLTTKTLKTTRRVMLVGDKEFTYQINPLFESQPDHPGVELPDDLFRITQRGIEFLDTDHNRVNRAKSELFNTAMLAEGFVAPAQEIYGIPSTIKSRDDGYFIVDAQGKLFHLMMVNGAPMCRAIDNDFQIKQIKCHIPGDLYCHIFTPDNDIYALTTNYELKKLAIGQNSGRIMATSNCYFRSYKTMETDSSTMYVMDSALTLVAQKSITLDSYKKSHAAEIEQQVFPFRLMMTPGYAHLVPIPNPVTKFITFNIVLTILLILLKIIRRRRFLNLFNLLDYAIVLVFGVYGFIAVLVFPNRK